MIDIRVYRENDAIRSVAAVGHAGNGKKGEQVCSGVSALMYTLALSLSEIKRVGVMVTDDDMGMSIEIIRGYSKKEVQVALNTILLGLKSICDTYPHYVRLRRN
ncbi:MAG: ribosomal-processing cysteine protease Prp [Clostridia bacterium]|nr:ribosomal-processing cysteine protease Prp [Clostridia bacterium]